MRLILIFMAAFSLLLACGQGSSPPSAEMASTAENADLYSCGMHPNVFQEGPGSCPICGMDLTPVRGAGSPAAAADPRTASGERKIKYWVAPMDPTFISDKPGKSPMGMDLVPVYEDPTPRESASGAVSIDPMVVQNMGVRITPNETARQSSAPRATNHDQKNGLRRL